MELAHSVALRYTEIMSKRYYSLKELTQCHEFSRFWCPIDAVTDCQDLWDNVVGDGNLPQDKAHRTYILALREEVRRQGIRLWTKTPTDCMLADGLTKPMKSSQLAFT